MRNYEELKEEAKQYIRYDKDRASKIAYLTFDRPEAQNATTAGMRQLYADYVFKANTDDDVKVLVIRGEGEHFGSGGDLPEQADMLSASDEDVDLRWEIGINDPDVTYPPKKSYRFLHTLTDHYAKAPAGCRPLQEFKKISIVEAKGYCYGWHFYQAGDADLVVASDDTLFGHPAFRYVGWGPRLWTWIEMMGLRKFEEMLFTGRPFTADEMKECNGFVNSVVPREELDKETKKYATACAQTRPTDTVQAQKTFIELYKQYRGEYMGSVLNGWLEGMLPLMQNDRSADVQLGDGVFGKGLNEVVKNNDMNYPPEWRLSRSGRNKP